LELIDVNGNARGWFLPMPAGLWGNFQIVANQAGPQGPFIHFFQTPGFDITQVVALRLDEAGNSVTLANPLGPNGLLVWNAWNHLDVNPLAIPEPALAGAGLLAVTLLALRRRTV